VIERLPSALLIAGASAASYWLAHTYEAAYLGYFGFPASLVRVGTTTTIIAAGAALSVCWFAFTIAVPVAEVFRRWELDTNTMLFVTVTLFRAFASLFIDPSDWHVWLQQAGIIVGLFVLFGLAHRVEKWAEKRAAAREKKAASNSQANTTDTSAARAPPTPAPVAVQQQAADPPSVPAHVASRPVARLLMPWIGREGLLLIFVLFQANAVARDAGTAEARKATRFFTFATTRTNVVLRAYDDLLVAAPLDRERHEVANEVVLFPAAKQAEIALRWDTVGPLKPADQKRVHTEGERVAAAHAAPHPCLSCHEG
jgi:hypothetical protein